MLPFLKRKDNAGIAGIIVKQRKPDEKPENAEEDDKDAAIHACAQDLINAIHGHDVKAAAEAIKSAFEILDAMPHEEGQHTNDFESQNIKAGQE